VKGGNWFIQYQCPNPDTGKNERKRENTEQSNREVAKRLLNERLAQIEKGEPFDAGRKMTVGMLYNALHEHTENHSDPGKRSVQGQGWRWNHLKKFFGHIPAANVTTAKIEAYTKQRRSEGAANATINRELATLRRMFRYGKQSTPPTVHTVPHIAMLPEDNVRQGSIDDDVFVRMADEAAKEGLWLRALIEVAFTYGWRRGELVSLRVKQVNLKARTIRLEPGTTKNKEGREAPMTDKVYELLAAACHCKKGEDWVFTRENGEPVRSFTGAWRNLCSRVGVGHWECSKKCGATWAEDSHTKCKCGGSRRYVGLIVHDFRRSAARALRNAGVPESVIMKIGGWKTASMFRRYAIVGKKEQEKAMEALAQARQKKISPEISPAGPNVLQAVTEVVQ
jgi:integrase